MKTAMFIIAFLLFGCKQFIAYEFDDYWKAYETLNVVSLLFFVLAYSPTNRWVIVVKSIVIAMMLNDIEDRLRHEVTYIRLKDLVVFLFALVLSYYEPKIKEKCKSIKSTF